MRLLLDTHAFLWFMKGENLSQKAQDVFLDIGNDLFLSAASYWEICIKHNLGKLDLDENWNKIFDREMLLNGIKWLPIEKEHSQGIIELPMLHRDPFDRLLIAQARAESMTLLTADSKIQQYDIPTIW
ncbi:MAG: type II toxin-antitoxin system VapC family toxin [Chloroflexi bacterium]|nr:type II toxin-antitoxin system VapC family toxin [Chloroflexota bacterium]